MGTAQFGLDYGITNTTGQVKDSMVANLLALADQNKITFLDTAQGYGNSEYVIGSHLNPGHDFHIISKLEGQRSDFFTSTDVSIWENTFQKTCMNLKVNKLGSFLIHSTDDLRKDGAQYLVRWLLALKDRGLVERLGVSIYNFDDLRGVNHELLDIVQLPLSLFDQRLLKDDTVNYLQSHNIKIHARSLYLQGLLLTPASDWPTWVTEEVIGHHHRLESLCRERECCLLDLVTGFAREQKTIEAVVIGICNIQQLKQLLDSWTKPSPWHKDEWKKWSLNDINILDPRLWPV